MNRLSSSTGDSSELGFFVLVWLGLEFFFLIEVLLIYEIMLVLDVQHTESTVIYITK